MNKNKKFTEYYNKYKNFVYYCSGKISCNYLSKKDIVSYGYVGLYKSFLNRNKIKNIKKTYVYKCVMGQILTVIKEDKPRIINNLDDHINKPVEKNVLFEKCYKIIAEKYSEKKVKIFELRYLYGLSNKEISEMYECTQQNISDLLIKLIKYLKTELKNRGYNETDF